MSKRINYFIAFLILSFFLPLTNLQARVNLDLDYSFILENHSDEDDRLLSYILLSVDDQYRSNRFNADINVISDNYYNHENNQNSNLWRGNGNANYKINNSLYWLADLELSEVNVTPGADYDEFNSQTLSNVSTGFLFRTSHSFRGEFGIQLITRQIDYEISELDISEDNFELSYEYPFNENTSITASVEVIKQSNEYTLQQINDFENRIFRLEFDKLFSRVSLSTFIEQNEVDYLNQPVDDGIETYGINFIYQLNTFSSIALEVSHDLQQVYELNIDLVNAQNPVLSSGLIENQRYSINYSYSNEPNIFSLEVYQNDFVDFSGLDTTSDRQFGHTLNYTHLFNNQLSFVLNSDRLNSEINASDNYHNHAIVNYIISQSSHYTSRLSLDLEDSREGGVDSNDNVLRLEIQAKLF